MLENKLVYEDEYVKLYKGDCFEIIKQLDNVDLVVTDPPYIQEFHGRGIIINRPNYAEIAAYGSNDNLDYIS